VRALIVDDEPLARDGMRLLLAEYPDIQLVGEAGNGAEALALVDEVEPDLMFVDVQMPGMSGLELAAALPEDRTPTIVFVTAYDEFALRAFDVHALDYVLKPIDEVRFAEAVRRARAQHELGARRLKSISEPPLRPSKLSIRDGDAIVFVPVDDIDWVEAADYYVEIHAGSRSYLMRETMQRLQALLDDRFVRIHRSRLVNRDRVREVRWENRGDMVVVMTNGVVLKVARSCRTKLDLRSKVR
jgi:two-component system, LytTR family, response regulator